MVQYYLRQSVSICPFSYADLVEKRSKEWACHHSNHFYTRSLLTDYRVTMLVVFARRLVGTHKN